MILTSTLETVWSNSYLKDCHYGQRQVIPHPFPPPANFTKTKGKQNQKVLLAVQFPDH